MVTGYRSARWQSSRCLRASTSIIAADPIVGAADRAAPPSDVAKTRAASQPSLPLMTLAVEGLQSRTGGLLGSLPAWTAMLGDRADTSAAGESQPAELPSTLVHVRVSGEYLRQFIERQIEKDHPVVDEILGTALKGQSHTTAQVKLALEPNPAEAVLLIVSRGTIEMTTRGVNGPIVLHSSGETHFQAKKKLVFDRRGITSKPAVAIAETTLTTRSLESTLPGIRGRVAERIGWKQVGETRGEAEAIAAQHAQIQIARCLDEEVDQALATLRQTISEQLAGLAPGPDGAPRAVRFATTSSHIHFAIDRGNSTDKTWLEDPADRDADVLARVHRVVVREAIRDPRLSKLLPLLVSQLADPSGAVGANLQPVVSWSPDRQWLVVKVKQARGSREVAMPTLQANSSVAGQAATARSLGSP